MEIKFVLVKKKKPWWTFGLNCVLSPEGHGHWCKMSGLGDEPTTRLQSNT